MAGTGAGGLTKVGSGILVLSAANTYAGGTTVTAGTLQVANNSALGSGGLTTLGGELDMNAYSLNLPSLAGTGGIISDESSPAAFPTLLTVSQTGSSKFAGTIRNGLNGQAVALTMGGTGKLVLSGSNTYSGPTTIDAGTLVVTSNSALPDGTNLTIAAGGTFVFDPSQAGSPVVGSAASPGIAAVPEPGTLALLAAMLLSAALYGRLHRRSKSAAV